MGSAGERTRRLGVRLDHVDRPLGRAGDALVEPPLEERPAHLAATQKEQWSGHIGRSSWFAPSTGSG